MFTLNFYFIFFLQNLETLALRNLEVSSTSLVDVCKTMSHVTSLNLVNALQDSRSDDVLMAISTGMPQLEWLDIAYANVSLSAIRYLLPKEEPPLGGCPELKVLGLFMIECVNVEILKDFIMGLPKLEHLAHVLMSNVLAELTDEEALIGLKCMDRVVLAECERGVQDKLRYDILQRAPKFAMTCDISRVELYLKGHTDVSLTELLMPFTKLDTIKLNNLTNRHTGLLTVLESKGHQLKALHLNEVIETISLHDIIRTCPSLCKFTLKYACGVYTSMNQEKQVEKTSGIPYLSNLKELTLARMDVRICSRVMLMALLVSPYLDKVTLTTIQVMSNDHLMNAYQACFPSVVNNPLTSLRSFHVKHCPNITAAPFVRLLAMVDTKLDELHIEDCNMDDEDVLHEAIENYPRPLNVRVRPINKSHFPGHMGTRLQGPCVKHCHYCAYDRRLSKGY